LWVTAGLSLIFVLAFAAYVYAEKQIDRANEQRLQSIRLTEELKHASNDLTRMARSYVLTGEPRYRHYYDEILAIRDGKRPRLRRNAEIYWDLILANPELERTEGPQVPLLQMIQEASFSAEERALLEKAWLLSDDLTRIELATMDAADTTVSSAAEARLQAGLQLHDEAYYKAKAAIMDIIDRCSRLADERTLARIKSAERWASTLRLVVILCVSLFLLSLWRAYSCLRRILGAPVETLYRGIVRLGSGDFAEPIVVHDASRDSIQAWLGETHEKLARLEQARYRAEVQSRRVNQLYAALSQFNQAIVRSASEDELFARICRDAVRHGGMRCAWVGMLDPSGSKLLPVAAYGDSAELLMALELDLTAEQGLRATRSAVKHGKPCWSQDALNDAGPTPCCESLPGCNWKSCAALPMHRAGRIVGAVTLYSDQSETFDTEERALLSEMAEDLDFALDNFMRAEKAYQTQAELAESRKLLQTIIDTAPTRIFWKDRDSRYLGANPLFARDAGLACPEDLIGLDDFQLVWREQAAQYRADDREVMETGMSKLSFGERQTTPEGKVIWIKTSKVPLRDAKGNTVGVLGIYQDITEEKRTETALLRSQTFLERAQAVAKIGSWYLDITHGDLEWSEETYRMFGIPPDQAVTYEDFLAKIHPEDRALVDSAWQAALRGESPYHVEHRILVGNETCWVEERAELEFDQSGHCIAGIGTVQDITERKQHEERINFLANYDGLTGLPNRLQLDEHLRNALSLARRNRDSLALMFLDLDHFKDINDTLGHRVGDALLVRLAQRLREILRQEDTLARLGGDEFILLLPATDALGATQVAQKIQQAFAETFFIDPYRLSLSASIGIALYPEDGTDMEALFKNADTAMYRAKQEGRRAFRFFTEEMQAGVLRKLQIINGLRDAERNAELSLMFQPQIALADRTVIGCEALLRWNHRDLGPVPPGEFIPIAEESGLILGIGEWVLRHAARQARIWRDAGLPPLIVSVNLSFGQLRHGDLAELVTRILEEENVPPDWLELELTEGVAMTNPQASIETMELLNQLGVRLAIDDFGTGYSSLSYLKKFRIRKLKIDQTFVRDIGIDPDDRAIVGAIIQMAQRLGLQTVAEGVETAEQLSYLLAQGCTGVQGYLFSRPVPAQQFESFVRMRN
jgi:diguanylate cyclase (GGDEF)-like protein/PAS domain S-box-containing protein